MSVETPKLEGKALITGASGFIGGRLRDALLDQGVDVLSIRRKGSPPSKKGRSVEASYDNLAELEDLVLAEKPDYVFHVAGVTKGVTYADFQAGNVMPTENLLRALERKHTGIKRFVHFSSLACFGPSTRTRPHIETNTRKPIEFYGRSKAEAEEVVERVTTVPWTILRPGGVYGPGDADYFNLFREVHKKRNVFFGNRDRFISNVYVDDLVTATLLATVSPNTVGKGYFVSDGEVVTWGQFQDAIVKAAGHKVRTIDFPEFFVTAAAYGGEFLTKLDKKPRLFNQQKAIMGAQEAWTCSIDALRADTGFEPTVFATEGCKRAFAWYRENGWL